MICSYWLVLLIEWVVLFNDCGDVIGVVDKVIVYIGDIFLYFVFFSYVFDLYD